MTRKLSTTAALSLLLAASTHSMAAGYQVVDVVNGGSISGKVTFSGDDPAPVSFKISKDNDVCGTGNRKVDYVRVSNGGLADVVVYIDKIDEGKAFNPEEQDARILQKGCEFLPYLQVMHNDNNAAIINEDPVLHNIHTYEIIGRAKKTVMNISQPDTGTINKTVKLRRGVGMKVECDAHDFMHGFVFVAKNPYYARVADDGSYTIENVPPGKYRLEAFHGTLGEEKETVEVTAGGSHTVDFTYKK